MTIMLHYKCILHAGNITVLKLLTLLLYSYFFSSLVIFMLRSIGIFKAGVQYDLMYNIEGFLRKFHVVPCVCQLQKIFATNRLHSRKLTNFIILFFTVPLLSRILPSDVCKVYKKGCSIR